eukprot:1161910-Pelagomonas_calceolata.AAC.2
MRAQLRVQHANAAESANALGVQVPPNVWSSLVCKWSKHVAAALMCKWSKRATPASSANAPSMPMLLGELAGWGMSVLLSVSSIPCSIAESQSMGGCLGCVPCSIAKSQSTGISRRNMVQLLLQKLLLQGQQSLRTSLDAAPHSLLICYAFATYHRLCALWTSSQTLPRASFHAKPTDLLSTLAHSPEREQH